MRYGYWNHAFDIWYGSGASCPEFDKLYSKAAKSIMKLSRAEAGELCAEVPHMDCKHCNSVIWEYEDCAGYCSNCGKGNEIEESA
jgi:hypothetical protein